MSREALVGPPDPVHAAGPAPVRLTLATLATYHPPDDERAPPVNRAIGAFACLLGSMTD